jgi:hypothetical protein
VRRHAQKILACALLPSRNMSRFAQHVKTARADSICAPPMLY